MNADTADEAPRVFKKNEHVIALDTVDTDALKIIRRLDRHGHSAYVVGGGVRDLLLEKAPKDYDIATDATPRQIKALFRNCRIIGRRFKLAHIYFRGNKIIEVSTFRDTHEQIEDEEDSELLIRRDNVYGTEHTDALRRDLTINALFYDPIRQTIIDYIGGMEDLREGIVRVIGEPDVRFAEDPVRMIRTLRHAARANFKIDPACSGAISEHHSLIEQCPPMRLYEELKKDLLSGSLLTILQLLREYRLLDHFLPYLSEEEYIGGWEPGSPFLDGLLRIDGLHQDGRSGTPTAIFSLLTLFYLFPEFTVEQFTEQRLTQQRLKDELDVQFSSLAVPRKEKERISLLIRDLQYALRLKAGTARKRRRGNRDNLQSEKSELLYYLGLEDLDNLESDSERRSRSRSGNRSRRKKQRPRKRNPRK